MMRTSGNNNRNGVTARHPLAVLLDFVPSSEG